LWGEKQGGAGGGGGGGGGVGGEGWGGGGGGARGVKTELQMQRGSKVDDAKKSGTLQTVGKRGWE